MAAAGACMAGAVLCRVGNCRLAFAAHEVTAIEASHAFPGIAAPARHAFGEPGEAERVLVADTGHAVSVDGLEVDAEALALLPLPSLLARLAGGSLRGFVHVRGALWPVADLRDFQRFLAAAAKEET